MVVVKVHQLRDEIFVDRDPRVRVGLRLGLVNQLKRAAALPDFGEHEREVVLGRGPFKDLDHS